MYGAQTGVRAGAPIIASVLAPMAHPGAHDSERSAAARLPSMGTPYVPLLPPWIATKELARPSSPQPLNLVAHFFDFQLCTCWIVNNVLHIDATERNDRRLRRVHPPRVLLCGNCIVCGISANAVKSVILVGERARWRLTPK